jgi:hypothetical protein
MDDGAPDARRITRHMFMIYVASVEGFSKFVEAKFKDPKERR